MDGKENNSEREPLQENLIIIGNKEISKYAFSILLIFEKFKEVIISANMSHTPNMERLIHLYAIHGVEEINRKTEGNRIQVTLARR